MHTNKRLDNEHREQRALNTMVNEELNKTGKHKHRKYLLRVTGTNKTKKNNIMIMFFVFIFPLPVFKDSLQ